MRFAYTDVTVERENRSRDKGELKGKEKLGEKKNEGETRSSLGQKPGRTQTESARNGVGQNHKERRAAKSGCTCRKEMHFSLSVK